MPARLSRRRLLQSAGVVLGCSAVHPVQPIAARERVGAAPFRYSLNTSTLRGHHLPIVQEVDIAAKAGYDAIEPWIEELETYSRGGGSLEELGKRIRDHGLVVESSIAFFEWIVDDETRRTHALEQARKNMEMVARIGGKRIAAPPSGATDHTDLDANRAAERYAALVDLGQGLGVVPQVEVWGFSKTLGRLGDAAQVAIQSDRPQACVLPDVFHLYKGGSGFNGMGLLSRSAVHNIHVNDYPAQPPRETITDAERVYPGDGVAPLEAIFRALRSIGFDGVLSLELFNREYWKQDPLTVARTGLEKTRAVVRRALLK